ncbi:MAG: hypothetical protein M3N95_09220 [Actinomycetota bacterium]|nr:hypothetical protein [Actinomycetota bacterium]
MGWIRDGAYDHEGWVANVLADGRVAGSSTGGGVIVHELAGDDVVGREVRRYPNTEHVDIVVPWDQVAMWRVTCQCGWTGSERPAVTDTKYGTRDCPESLEDFWAAPEWDDHVAPFAALADLEQLVDQLRDVETTIEDKVRLARAGGASWSQVGRAAGLSKQGAQQRWGHLVADPVDVTARVQ